MLKRILVILLICVTVLCCTACGQAPYDIIEKDGKHYISFNVDLLGQRTLNDGVSPVISGFTSIGQMKRKIESCAFDDNEFLLIQHLSRKNFGLLEICDLNNLYDVRTPQDVTLSSISWTFDSYTFYLESQIAPSFSIDCHTPKDYKYCLVENYTYCPSPHSNAYGRQEEKISDRNATQIFYQTDVSTFKTLKYEIKEENRTLYVAEKYRLTSSNPRIETSRTVPYHIDVFIEENGAFVHMHIYEPTERPSVEWLSSFGVTPYEG